MHPLCLRVDLPDWVFANDRPVVPPFTERKRKWWELERMAQPSTLLDSVLCLPCGFQTAAVMESCFPIQP